MRTSDIRNEVKDPQEPRCRTLKVIEGGKGKNTTYKAKEDEWFLWKQVITLNILAILGVLLILGVKEAIRLLFYN